MERYSYNSYFKQWLAQSAGAAEYTDCISAEYTDCISTEYTDCISTKYTDCISTEG